MAKAKQLVEDCQKAPLNKISRCGAELASLENEVETAYQKTLQPWAALGIRPYVKGGGIYLYPGKPFHVYGTNDFAAIYKDDSSGVRQSVETDYRHMAELGYKAIRVPFGYEPLEPQQGKFDPEYLRFVENCVKWADKYGLYVIMDLHRQLPDWFMQGPSGEENKHAEESNPYYYLEALEATFRRLAEHFRDYPNILCWEVPLNEPSISSGDKPWTAPTPRDATIADMPRLLRLWNEWLKAKYGTLEALNAAWTNTPFNKAENGLGPDETWERNSIMPPGVRGEKAEYSTRLYDYMQWAAELHYTTVERLSRAIKEEIPEALTSQQVPEGGPQWELDPIPIDMHAFQQWSPPNVDMVTCHYGAVGHGRLLAATGKPWYAGEHNTGRAEGSFINTHALGGGMVDWAYSAIPDPGENLRNLDLTGRLFPDRTYLPLISEFFQNSFLQDRNPQVAVIANARLYGLAKPRYRNVTALLDQMKVSYDVLSSLYVVKEPQVLAKYKAAVMGTDYADPTLLALLWESKLPVFYYGTIGPNITANFGRDGIGKDFVAEQLFFKEIPGSWGGADSSAELPLEGNWRFQTMPEDTVPDVKYALADYNDGDWDWQSVPAYFENVGVMGKARVYDGIVWYRTNFYLPKDWERRLLTLEIGAIDDFDWSYVNGVLIGKTGAETDNYWQTARNYPIPSETLKFGAENTLAICVQDTHGNGGIWKAPVRITSVQKNTVHIDRQVGYLKPGDEFSLSLNPNLTKVETGELLPNVSVLATFENQTPALMEQDHNWLWLGADILGQEDNDLKLIASFLDGVQAAHTYPPTAQSRYVRINEYQRYVTVSNSTNKDIAAEIFTTTALEDVLGTQLEQELQPGISRVNIPSANPWGSGRYFRKTALEVKPEGRVTIADMSEKVWTDGAEVNFQAEGAASYSYRYPTVEEYSFLLFVDFRLKARGAGFGKLEFSLGPDRQNVKIVITRKAKNNAVSQ